MYVVCTACQDVFKVQSAHLAVAQGHVRCGGCQVVFDATASLYDTLEEAGQAAQRMRQAQQEIDGVVDVALASMQKPSADTCAVVQTQSNQPDTALPREGARPGIDSDFYAQPAERHPVSASQYADVPVTTILDDHEEPQHGISGKVWWGLAASVLLSALLTGQYVWKQRDRLAADASLRPWLERYCAVLHCDLPLRHDVSKIEILERDVRDHPQVKDALLISATFVNEAPYIQAYPVFEISFSDMSGTPVSVRRFEPQDYLPAEADPAAGLPPGKKTRLMLEVLDPGKNAVSYQLAFL